MLKQILNLNGVQKLSKNHLLSINGGINKCCIVVPSGGITDAVDAGRNCTTACRVYRCCGGDRPNNLPL